MLSETDKARYTGGECCFFALALRDAFNIQAKAIVETCKSDGYRNLVHAYCVMDNYEIDANGVHPLGTMQLPTEGTIFPDEESFFEIINNVTEEDFEAMRDGMYCYDFTDKETAEAHRELINKIKSSKDFNSLINH